MSGFIDWLSHVPLAALYLIMALFAAVENVFPPVPADTIVALGSWLAARGQGSPVWAFLATWIGNIAGAAAIYFVGRWIAIVAGSVFALGALAWWLHSRRNRRQPS